MQQAVNQQMVPRPPDQVWVLSSQFMLPLDPALSGNVTADELEDLAVLPLGVFGDAAQTIFPLDYPAGAHSDMTGGGSVDSDQIGGQTGWTAWYVERPSESRAGLPSLVDDFRELPAVIESGLPKGIASRTSTSDSNRSGIVPENDESAVADEVDASGLGVSQKLTWSTITLGSDPCKGSWHIGVSVAQSILRGTRGTKLHVYISRTRSCERSSPFQWRYKMTAPPEDTIGDALRLNATYQRWRDEEKWTADDERLLLTTLETKYGKRWNAWRDGWGKWLKSRKIKAAQRSVKMRGRKADSTGVAWTYEQVHTEFL
jgi:hypothetical protein